MSWSPIANLKGPPGKDGRAGEAGAQGLPGTGALPADSAVAGYISTPGTSETKKALLLSISAETAGKANSSHIGLRGQDLTRMDSLCHWTARTAGTMAWVQGFSINEITEEIYAACYDYALPIPAQWIEVRKLDGTLKSRSNDIPVTATSAYSEGLPYFFNTASQLCFIIRIDVIASLPAGSPKVRIYNYVTGELSDPIPVAGNSKLYNDGEYFYCATSESSTTRIPQVFVYTLASIIAKAPVLVNTIRLEELGQNIQDEKAQGVAVSGGNILVSSGKRDGGVGGYPSIRTYGPSGAVIDSVRLDRQDFRDVLAAQTDTALVNPSGVNYENESLYVLADGRVAVLHILYSEAFITIHGTGSADKVRDVPPIYVRDTGWVNITLASGITAYSDVYRPQYRRIDNVVYIRGAFKGVSGPPSSNITLGILPNAVAPSLPNHQFLMPSGGTTFWRGLVTNGGNVQIVSHSDAAINSATFLPLSTSYVINDLESIQG